MKKIFSVTFYNTATSWLIIMKVYLESVRFPKNRMFCGENLLSILCILQNFNHLNGEFSSSK